MTANQALIRYQNLSTDQQKKLQRLHPHAYRTIRGALGAQVRANNRLFGIRGQLNQTLSGLVAQSGADSLQPPDAAGNFRFSSAEWAALTAEQRDNYIALRQR